MRDLFIALSSTGDGQDIAEYAVMVAVILIIVVGTLRLIGSNSNTVFSIVSSGNWLSLVGALPGSGTLENI
jgi:Flp pilus assembly pilin Flp